MNFTNFAANAGWLFIVCLSSDWVRWFQLVCLSVPRKDAGSEKLCWSQFHATGHLARRSHRLIVRAIHVWPITKVLTNSHGHMAPLT
jgi:hypothetical protein